MRPGTPGFVGERLREAREARGLTQISLGEMLGVTNRAISQYENGTGSPHPEIMQKIPEVLNIPLQFFLTPITEEETTNGPIFYRSMSSATATARTRAERKFGWLKRIVDFLQDFVEFPKVNFPDYNFSNDPLKITKRDIEESASELRKYWGLGDGPISNVVYLLENNGAIVSRINLYADTLDAFSNWRYVENRPYIILGSDKESAARSRFDAAHELGHIILHRHIDSGILRNSPKFKEIELQAAKFAGAFLLPSTSFADDFLTPTLDALLVLKSKWNVSIGAMLVRAQELNLINSERASRLWRYYARRGYKKGEPLDDKVKPEEPELLRQALTVIIENKIQTKAQVISRLCLGQLDIEELTGLTPGYLSDKPKVKTLPKVVPFRKPDKRK